MSRLARPASGRHWIARAPLAKVTPPLGSMRPEAAATPGVAVIDYAVLRRNMVDSQVRPSDVFDRRLMAAMLVLPREEFVPDGSRALAYSDEDLPLRGISGMRGARSLLAPRTLAKLLQVAEVASVDRILDVGCASGYATVLLSRLAASVIGLESDAELARMAEAALRRHKVENASIVNAPLQEGHDARAPYDVILVEGSVPDVPEALLAQLADRGRLLVVVATQNGFGAATLYRRSGNVVGGRAVFEAGAPALPGFERAAGFVF
jgi:protein-L-isoaspartate(D-aspartate) O-methyltransferase